MSGHSKWATIKRQKATTDAKKSNLFTALAANITIAAREGGDPEFNFKLKIAIERAKSVNMPKDNIERSIKRGTGELGGAEIQEIIYECFGPSGSAFIVQAFTDNKNRAISEIRTIFTKNGGSVGASGAVMWQFDQKGIVNLKVPNKEKEDFELMLIEAGADDIIWEDEGLTVYTAPEEINNFQKNLEKLGIKPEDANIGYIAKEKKNLSDEAKKKIEKILEGLENCEDASDFWTNVEI